MSDGERVELAQKTIQPVLEECQKFEDSVGQTLREMQETLRVNPTDPQALALAAELRLLVIGAEPETGIGSLRSIRKWFETAVVAVVEWRESRKTGDAP